MFGNKRIRNDDKDEIQEKMTSGKTQIEKERIQEETRQRIKTWIKKKKM